MEFFGGLEMAPPDPILGLAEAFRKDDNPDKINLTTGVYQDETATTPIFSAVKKAEQGVLEGEISKSYLPINGSPEFGEAVQRLIFGAGHEIIKNRRAITAQAPGGTGSLRVAGEFLHQLRPNAYVWLTDPTWPNHPGVFNAARMGEKSFRYYNPETKGLDWDELLDDLSQVSAGDVVLFHGCCHNPTGADPSPQQWEELASLANRSKFLPLFDLAYQGLGDGLDEDAAGIRAFCKEGCELLIANSFSKNFGLYNERVGALTLVAKSEEAAQIALSHLKRTIRTLYSNPPAHGAAIVTAILSDSDLERDWLEELNGMRDRLAKIRQILVDTLKKEGVKEDFGFLTNQKGMFSYTGLNKGQVEKLRNQHSIYMVASGRVNVAGLNEGNIERFCKAVASVL